MPATVLIWLQFTLCLALIGLACERLIRYGDAISELTGLSRNWIVLILVATVTSPNGGGDQFDGVLGHR